MDLRTYDALSFDCYGTLIDWETGFSTVLDAWAHEQGLGAGREQLLQAYATAEATVMRETPAALYPDVLAAAFRRAGEQLGAPVDDRWAARLGSSVPDWPAFEDSARALADLAARYKMIILSNVDRAGFAASNRRLGITFDAVVTAQDVGSYKPAPGHFDALADVLADLGVSPRRHLHVAQSLFHDHSPARRHGIDSVWINRRHRDAGWGATPRPTEASGYLAEYPSLAAFADDATGAGACC